VVSWYGDRGRGRPWTTVRKQRRVAQRAALKTSSQLASNLILQSLIPVVNFSVLSNSLSRPKIVSTNSLPELLPMYNFSLPRSRLAVLSMCFSQTFNNLLKRSQSLSPLSRKSSMSSRSSRRRIRERDSSARLILPASWIRESQRSPAISVMGVEGPWNATVQS
jgi:hypothetical protein